MTRIVVEVLGWIGALLLLYAYSRVSSGHWNGESRPYQYLNVAGSVLFILNSGYNGAYPSVAVNVIWAAIAIKVLAKP